MYKSILSLLWNVEYIDDKHAWLVQSNLLKIILVTTCILTFISASLAVAKILPFGTFYSEVLYVYMFTNMVAYWFIEKSEKYYTLVVNILIYSSLITFSIMVIDVIDDAFRFIWFFLLSFSAYIFGGRRYGLQISIMIYTVVLILYFTVELYLSIYVLITFVASFFAFNIFMVYFLIKINIDVETLQTRVNEEVEKRQKGEQVLLRKYRMANMGEMIDAIAHQWRHPLARANMILMNMDEEKGNQTYIDKRIIELTQLNEHMSQTIDDFRHLLHDEKMKMTFDVSECIEEVLELMRNQLHTILVTHECCSCKIKGYKNELIQVLIILISNAIDALNERDIENKNIKIDLNNGDRQLTIVIEDNAGGIANNMMPILFDPYVTSKISNGGTGLGLYIAKLIIEDTMHGSLQVSNTTSGAKFEIGLKKEI